MNLPIWTVLLPTLTHLSDDAIGLILILTCPAILSLVSLSDLKSEIYTFTADWSVSMAMVQWLYTKDAKFSQVFGSSSIVWMYTCATGQWLTVNIFYGHTTRPIWGEKIEFCYTSQAPHVCQENTFFFFINEIDNSACTIFFQSDNSCHCIFGELLFYMRY